MKRLLFENLATKAMALFLAVLTWVYLFTQGNGSKAIDVEFQPLPLDREVFASAVYKDGDGRELKPGGPLKVVLTGPRGQIDAVSDLIYSCKVRVDPKTLTAPQGSGEIILQRKDFDLPASIQVQPLPSAQIKFDYVKYVETELDLAVPPDPGEGSPKEGFKLGSVTVLPPRIKAKVPADLPAVEKAAVRRVPVAGRFESFTLDRWELEPGSRILPQTPFRVEVRIVAVPATRRFPLDLHLLTKEENKARIRLDEKTVTVELQGPKELIDTAPESAFAAFVLVTDADVATAGPKNIGAPQLGCHILDPRYAGKVTVVVKADVTVENRQVKISVSPK